MMRLQMLLAGLLVVAGAAWAGEDIDFRQRVTPACELAGLLAVPPSGWFNVPFENPPEGSRGCMMILTNESEEPVAIVRIRSLAAPALRADGELFETLFASEVDSIAAMGYAFAEEPLFVRNEVPVKGAGFLDGRVVVLSAVLEGNPIPQEAHLLMFRSDRAEYIISLMTPARSHEPQIYKRNIADFGTLIRTLQQRSE
jgi:hypothetical protein